MSSYIERFVRDKKSVLLGRIINIWFVLELPETIRISLSIQILTWKK